MYSLGLIEKLKEASREHKAVKLYYQICILSSIGSRPGIGKSSYREDEFGDKGNILEEREELEMKKINVDINSLLRIPDRNILIGNY